MKNHLMCFKNSFECVCYRVPLLFWTAVGSLWMLLSNLALEALCGKLMITGKEMVAMGDGSTYHIVKTAEQASTFLQVMVYTFGTTITVGACIFVFCVLIPAIYNELKSIKQTAKECRKCDHDGE